MTGLRGAGPMRKGEHQRLWRLIEGGVVDALKSHPEYLTEAGRRTAVCSITKRVAGQLVGHFSEARKRGDFGPCQGEGVDEAPCPSTSGGGTAGVQSPAATGGLA